MMAVNGVPIAALLLVALTAAPGADALTGLTIGRAAANRAHRAGVAMHAAKRKPANSKGRGFGPKPPSVDEILAGLTTRQPEDATTTPCACGSGEPYAACCRPYHSGELRAESCERLIRARYSAFAYRLPGFIVDTTHPENRDYQEDKARWVSQLDRVGMFDSFEFVGLEIGGGSAGDAPEREGEGEGDDDTERFLDFRVELRATRDDGTIPEGSTMTVRERSRFLRDESGDVWLYASGEVKADVDGLENTVLNN